MTALIVILIIIGLYVFFIAAPAVACTLCVFTRRNGTPAELFRAEGTPFENHIDDIRRAKRHIESLPGTREVSVVSADGLTLRGLYVDAGSPKTVVFAHGYRSNNMMNFAVQGEIFYGEGYNLLFIVQRAHDASEGRRSTLGLREADDLMIWTDYALSLSGVETAVIYGTSMGAYSAAICSDRFDPVKVRALIIDCGFSSPYAQLYCDCKKRRMPAALLMPLVRLTVKLMLGADILTPASGPLGRTAIPAFFLHGTADETVPYAQGTENYEACASEKRMFPVEGGHHTSDFLEGGEDVRNAMFDFLNNHTDTDTKE